MALTRSDVSCQPSLLLLSFGGWQTVFFYWNHQTQSLQAGAVVAHGVTIDSGAIFALFGRGGAPIPVGTSFLGIDNTAAIPIAGTFGNLSDGGTISANLNTFQANYEGGDGNDLTLTVVP